MFLNFESFHNYITNKSFFCKDILSKDSQVNEFIDEFIRDYYRNNTKSIKKSFLKKINDDIFLFNDEYRKFCYHLIYDLGVKQFSNIQCQDQQCFKEREILENIELNIKKSEKEIKKLVNKDIIKINTLGKMYLTQENLVIFLESIVYPFICNISNKEFRLIRPLQLN